VGSPKPRRSTHLASEDEVLELIRHTLGDRTEAFGLRDDAAVLGLPAASTLVASVDCVVEGVHVDLSVCTPGDVGWKALMGALSDLAAMGAAPFGALVALCLPGGSGEGELALGVTAGVAEAAAAAGCPVVGGDVSEAAQLVVAVTVLGTVGGDGVPVSRSGARPGDVLLVTGPCGASAAGLRGLRAGTASTDAASAYRRPVARVREGMLAREAGARAMIDISDGLALDLHRLADASGVGFTLDDVPVAPGASLADALGGGEDYELVVALSARDADTLTERFESAGLRAPVRIGSVVSDRAERLLNGEPLEGLGWQHRVG